MMLFLIIHGPAAYGAINESPINSLLGSSNTIATAPVQYLTDSKTETIWEMDASAPGWVELGLAEPVLIDGLRFYGTFKGLLTAEYWKDSGWHSFLAVENLPGNLFQNGWNLLDLSYDRIVTGRIRLRLTNDGSPKLGGIGELKVLGRRVQDILRRIDPVTVTSSDRFNLDYRHAAETSPGEYLFDQNTYTGWELRPGKPQETAETVADLGENALIGRIKFFSGKPADSSKGWFKRAVRLKIQYQKDGNWIDFPGLSSLDLSKLGAESGPAWHSMELANQNITAAKIRIQLSGDERAGILKEVEIWGKKSAGLNSRYLYTSFGPVQLSDSVAANYQFSIPWEYVTQPVKGVVNLHLTGTGAPSAKLIWELNGRPMGELVPAGAANGSVFFREAIAPETLWNDVNFIRVKGNDFTILDCRLELAEDTNLKEAVTGGLTDRRLLAPAAGEIIDLGGRRHLDEIELYYTGNTPPVQLMIEQNGQWITLTPSRTETGTAGGSFIYTPASAATRIRVEYPGVPGNSAGPAELIVYGSRIDEGAPKVRILAPRDGEVLDLTEWVKQKLVGTVDNPEAEIRVNGIRIENEGTAFEVPFTSLGLKSNEAKTIEVVATDGAGRTGTDKITVCIGLPPNFTVNLPDRIIYTKEAQITVSGQVLAPSSRVFINGVEAPVKNKAFSMVVPLQEGLNPITIKASLGSVLGFDFSNIKLRQVVRSSTTPYLKVFYPADGMITREPATVVSGTVGSLQPLQVTVNGQAAVVTSGSFTSRPVSLVEGDNPITVIATDQSGLASQVKLTVKRDQTPPEITELTPEENANINTPTIKVSGKVRDASPVSVMVNGQAANLSLGANHDSPIQWAVAVNGSEGWNELRIEARDSAGNLTTVIRRVFIDTKPPAEFTPVAEPGVWTNNNRPVITFGTTDAGSGIDHYELILGDVTVSNPAASPFRFDTPVPDGEQTVMVIAVDKAGNSRSGNVKIYIDTTPPKIPPFFRTVPGNGQIILKWDQPDPDVVEYRIERNQAGNPLIYSVTALEYTDAGLTNGNTYQYRIEAIDHAGNASEVSKWAEGMAGLAVAEYQPEKGSVVEYDQVTLFIKPQSLPDSVQEVQVTEIKSEALAEQAIFPIAGPIYQFTVSMEAGQTAQELEHTVFKKDFVAQLTYDPELLPEGFPEQNLGVYYFDPMWSKWFKVDRSGVDVEHHTIYFLTNHFTAFSVQPTMMEDLTPQELQDIGYSPFKTASVHEGLTVSPQGGSAMAQMTELVLPGRNGFDFALKRFYDAADARGDALGLSLNAELGLSIGRGAINTVVLAQAILNSAGVPLTDIEGRIKKYLQNNGDYSYSMGIGWRLNLPYIRSNNNTVLIRLPNGSFYSLNQMKIINNNNSSGFMRTLTLENHEGSDFRLELTQVRLDLNYISLLMGSIPKGIPGWVLQSAKLTLNDGAIYQFDSLGRTTRIIDPSGLNTLELHYGGPTFNYFGNTFGLQLDYIKDSMGREIHFGYNQEFLIPRINKIWIAGDTNYHREINYSLGSGVGNGTRVLPLLKKATDIGGREWNYEYGENFLFSGGVGIKINVLASLADLLTGGAFSALTGLDDLTLSGHLQAEWIFSLLSAAGPGIGYTKVEYEQRALTYNQTEWTDYFLGLVPVSYNYRFELLQRLLVKKLELSKSRPEAPYKTVTYDYDFYYHSHDQFYCRQTIENDGRKKIVYKYSADVKTRIRFIDFSDYEAELLNNLLSDFTFSALFINDPYTYEVIPYNTEINIYDATTNQLLERQTILHDLNLMRPKEQTTYHGANYHRITYSYDKWGNTTYTWDYSTSGARVNQTKTWIYFLGVSNPSSEVTWLDSPYSQPALTKPRHNLPVGKVVANYVPLKGGDQSITYLYSYNQYNEIGQLTGNAQWDGGKWLFTKYEYHPTFGSITKKTDPENHETVYDYDQYGLPAVVTEKAVKDAKGGVTDIVTRTGYEYISGWKLWQQNPRGFVTEYQYDALGRTTKIIAPDDDPGEKGWIPLGSTPAFRLNNPTTKIEYNDVELSSEVTDARGGKTKYDFDNLGKLVQLVKYQRVDGQYTVAAITDLQYDSWGNIRAIIDPNRKTTQYEYDALGRNIAIVYPQYQGKTPRKSMSFDYDTNLLTVTDENGNISYEFQDMQGRTYKQVKYSDSEAVTAERYFDGLGNEVIAVDPKGSVTVKTYNTLNQLARVDLPAENFWENGRAVMVTPYRRYEYDAVGRQTAEIYALAGSGSEQVNRIDVDELGRAIRTITPYTDQGVQKEAVSEVYYDGNGNKVRVVDANNTPLPEAQQKATVYTYSAADLLLAETGPAGNVTSYTYDAVGNRTAMTDPRGNSGKYSGDFTIIYNYDDLNRLVEGYLPKSQGETEKPLVQLRYDARGNLERRIEPDGGVTVYTYTGRNWVETETVQGDGGSYVTVHKYDLAGNETETVDPRGNSTQKEYDGLNRLKKVTYPEGNSEWFEYDVNNNRTGYINGKSIRTGYSYDRYNHLLEVKDVLGGTTAYSYDRWGNMTQMENALGHKTRYQYDELNRLLMETDPQGYTEQYRYDAVGNRVWSKDPNGTESVYEYYPNNLVEKVTLTNGSKIQTMEYQYDEAGYRKRIESDGIITEYNNNSGVYQPDPFGRVRKETKSFDNKVFNVGYAYDVMGRVTKITYPTGQAVDYQYNNLGQLVKVPGYIEQKPVYDQGGLLKSLTAANGVVTSWDYDKNGRLTKLEYSSLAATLKEYTFGYDEANNIIKKNQDDFQYDLLNQLLYANLKGDFEINPDEEVQTVGKVRNDYNKQTPLEFAVQAPDIIEMDYAAGSIGVDLLAPVKVNRIELKPNSPLHRITAGTVRVYISQNNLAYTKVDGWRYETRDKGGFAIILDTPVTARYVKLKSLYDDRDVEYNPVNKSTFANVPNDLITVYYLLGTRLEEYTYDKIGNRKTEMVMQRYPMSRTYEYYPNSSRLKSNGKYSFEYDPNGNLTKKTTTDGKLIWNYDYDLLNRLVSVKKNGEVVSSYVYDDSGLRIEKQGPSTMTYYTFDTGGNVLFEQEGNQCLSYIYVLGKHFARVDGNLDNSISKKYFYHTDNLGSTVAVTDEQGQTVWSGDYTPFGKVASQNGMLESVKQFTGKDLDEDTGLYYFNARWMDSETGRFISEDPLGQGPNLYSYCGNNPLAFLDPSGLWYYTLDEESGNWYGVAEENDTLWGLSEKAYGTGDYAEQLQTSNNIEDPTTLQPGDFILMGDYNDIGRGLHGDLLKVGYLSGGVSYDTIKAQGFNPWSLLSEKEQIYMAKQYRLVNELYNAGSISEEQYNKEMSRMETQDGKAVKGKLYDMAYGNCSAGYDELWALGGFAAYRLVQIFGPAILTSPIVQQLLRSNSSGDLPEKEASTFRFGEYSARILETDEILVRYFGGNAQFAGRYLTSPSGITGVQFFDRMNSAIRTGWNTMEGMAWYRIPAGTLIYEGQAATKFPWIGGGYQVFINLHPAEIAKWIIGIE
jgi:RHS repeat-associated protein